MFILWSLQLYLFGISVNSNICIEDIYIDRTSIQMYVYVYIYRVSQEECVRLREGVPYVNPLPVQLKALLHGQKGCVFFSGHLNLRTAPETGLPSREKKTITIKLKKTE